MKNNKELCKIYETEYAARYNTYKKVYCNDVSNKYNVKEEDLTKKRPIYVFKKGGIFSVCFMVTTQMKNNSVSVKWPKDGRWDNVDRWILFQPIIVPNNSIWGFGKYEVPDNIVRKHYNALIKSSSRKDESKNYIKHLKDSIEKISF